MGKTIGNKGDVLKYDERHIGSDGHYKDGQHIIDGLVRHPNKKKKHFMTKEFNEIGCIKDWRNRFDEEHCKSSRMHSFKSAQNGSRRAKMKQETDNIINDAINDTED